MSSQGLRARKKQETRESLQSAALQLTVERGLDRVTIEDIAAQADVSPRTFFNYFSCKEEAVVGQSQEWRDRVSAVLDERPVGEDPLTALQAVLGELAEDLSATRADQLLRRQVVIANPSLFPRQLANYYEFERVLVDGVRARLGTGTSPDLFASLVVNSVVAALRVSVDYWLSTETPTDLPRIFDEAVDRLRAGLTPTAPRKDSQ